MDSNYSSLHANCYKYPAPNTLLGLPIELLQVVADNLTPVDKASLAICNLPLLNAFGKESLSLLSNGNERTRNRELFLTTLARDLPDYFFCFHCNRLHSVKSVGPPGPALQPRRRLTCLCIQTCYRVWECLKTHPSPSLYTLSFPHIQLAMERHRRGPNFGISPESLAFIEVHVSRRTRDPEPVTTLLSVDARMCSEEQPSLCLRIQQWVLISVSEFDKILHALDYLKICDHIPKSNLSELSEAIGSASNSHKEIGLPTRNDSELSKCDFCDMDYQIDIKDMDDKERALVITRWVDLGAGLKSLDHGWTARSGQSRPEEGLIRSAGDIRLRFESQSGLSQNSLTHQNSSLLTAGTFKKAMDPWGISKWILQAGERLPWWYPFERVTFWSLLASQLSFIVFVISVCLRATISPSWLNGYVVGLHGILLCICALLGGLVKQSKERNRLL